jgi:hypothetical protein
LAPALVGKSPADLIGFTVADICCGSGIFLLGVYEFIMDHYLSWYLANQPADHVGRTIYEAGAGQWRLTYEEKRRILQSHVRGVDIDASAVEVAQFSLLLKLIENETRENLAGYVTRQRERALPDLNNTVRSGNSLVSQAEWIAAVGAAMPVALIRKVNPFDWAAEFPAERVRGGFDVIVGNPPYIRIQNMTGYSPEEAAFYQRPTSPYTTARQDNFDKYALFFERALTLLRPAGRLGFITPHKFMTIQAGRTLRRLLTADHLVDEVVHFGVKQVFGRAANNYTCILVLDRSGKATVRVEQIGSLEAWRYGEPGTTSEFAATALGEEPWQFADVETHALFTRVHAAHVQRLGGVAEIFVGVQTSADDIYIFQGVAETAATVSLHWNDRDWPIERAILRPCLHDVQLIAYARPEPNAWIIFPYELVTAGEGTTVRLLQPAEMASRFPRCLAYLQARRAELEARHVSGGTAAERQFYQFGRSQSLAKFNSTKIILPALSVEPRYAYDDANIVVTGGGNGPYYLLRARAGAAVTDKYLLAVLNHPLSEAFVRTNTSPFRGGYYAHGKQFIKDLPIPLPNAKQRADIDTLVAQTMTALAEAAAARTPHDRMLAERRVVDFRARIEDSITLLFGLSAADIEIVRAVPVPS